MAVFVLGAGATRGASFVNPRNNPCMPPLNNDFYTQIQRIENPKHQETIDNVIEDTVDLFGVNFDATLETVFTTIENTIRMIEATQERRDYKREDLKEKRDYLLQAIGAVMEESLTKKKEGEPSREHLQCIYHKALVKNMRIKDTVISFNYDCLIDDSLKYWGKTKWNPKYGYCLPLRAGHALKGYEYWEPQVLPKKKGSSIKLLKLHGSLHFNVQGQDPECIKLKQRPYTKQAGKMRFDIIPPESSKTYNKGIYKGLWKKAGVEIHKSKALVFIGYSFSPNDLHSTALFRISVKNKGLRSLVIANKCPEARKRTLKVLQRGIGKETRVLVFDTLQEFARVSRNIWDLK